MIIVRLQGGLGNQLFQYAFGRALSLDAGQKLYLDSTHYIEIRPGETPRNYALEGYALDALNELPLFVRKAGFFNPGKESFVRKRLRQSFLNLVREPAFTYQDMKNEVRSFAVNVFEGYWQSEKYFRHHRELLLRDLRWTFSLSAKSALLLDRIKETSSIAVHIRRGDYVSNPFANSTHGVCSKEYYSKAIDWMINFVSNPTFYFFSDDMEWVQHHFKQVPNAVFSEGSIPQEDLLLMSACQHQIIANSSFSWWGAWLNSNVNKKVIAPRQWFKNEKLNAKDLFLAEWTLL